MLGLFGGVCLGHTVWEVSMPDPGSLPSLLVVGTKSRMGFAECFTVHRNGLIFAFSFIAKPPMGGGLTTYLYLFIVIPAGCAYLLQGYHN